MVSFDEKTNYRKLTLIRPLIKFKKNDLIYITNNIFTSYIEDPSNNDDKFARVRIRKLITTLQSEGLDKNKFLLTIKNLKSSNETIKYYVNKNLKDNTSFNKVKKSVILKKEFFNQPREIVFRSFSEIIKLIGKKFYNVRGKKLDYILDKIKTTNKTVLKQTLGNCLVKKVNSTVIVSKEL